MTKRRRLTKAEFDTVWQRQLGLCSCGCGEKLVAGDYDEEHTLPLWLGGGNGVGNVTLMLKGHHLPKTVAETKARAKSNRIRLKEKGGTGHRRKYIAKVGGGVKRNPNARKDVPW